MSTLSTLDDVRAFVARIAATLDPRSRYVPELLEIVAGSADVSDLVRRLQEDSRGMRHAGGHVFARMSLEQKLRCNLITNETVLFRFTEGEWLMLQRRLIPAFARRAGRVLSAPCSHGEEAFSLAAACLQAGVDFRIDAIDIQPECIAEARTGRMTMGFPLAYLESPAVVGAAAMRKIDFRTGDLLVSPGSDGIPDATWDLVVCRNFLGYFVEDLAVACVERLASRVLPGGALFLDSFAIGKFPALLPSLARGGLERFDAHPVFLKPE